MFSTEYLDLVLLGIRGEYVELFLRECMFYGNSRAGGQINGMRSRDDSQAYYLQTMRCSCQ